MHTHTHTLTFTYSRMHTLTIEALNKVDKNIKKTNKQRAKLNEKDICIYRLTQKCEGIDELSIMKFV